MIVRNSEKDIKIRGLEIHVDGEFVLDLQYGNQREIPLTAGEHELKVTNTLYSKKETFEIGEGQTVRFETGNVVTGFGAVLFTAVGMGPYKVFLRRA